uniref:Uncharacterized protein n=1 Tax=Anguilla anguilla TaxID=7936 RepID=A0A0E9T8U1_ANGAN
MPSGVIVLMKEKGRRAKY